MQLSQKSLKLLVNMLHCPPMEEDEVEDFGSLADIFIPLGESATSGLSLRAQVLKQRQESSVLDIGSLCLDQALHILQVVEYLMRLLHVILIAGLKDTPFALLVMEEPQLYLDIHGVFKLLDALLHGAKVTREVILGLLFDKGEDDGQLVEEVVHCMQDGV